MKKILKYLLAVLLFFTVNNVSAQTFNTYLSANSAIYENNEVKVTVGVKNATNLYGLRAQINYDKTKLTFVSAQGLNNFGVEVGTYFVADSSNPVNGSKQIATLKFKATSNFKIGEKTTITLGTAEGSDGENLMTSPASSVTISVVKPKNSNNNLKTLSVNPGSITFNKNTTNYKVTVENNIEEITISGTAQEGTSKVSGLGKKNLEIYSNFFDVVVTAQNGAKKIYTIEVIRKDEDGNAKELSKDNTLESLSVENYPFIFSDEINEYTILLKDNVNSLNITTKTKDENASVTIKEPESYKKGNNIVTIEVIAENGDKKEYKINAIKIDEVKEVVKEPVKNSFDFKIIIIILLILIYIASAIAGFILYKKGIIKLTKKKH